MAEKKEEGAFEGINEPYKDTEEAFSEIPPPPTNTDEININAVKDANRIFQSNII